MSLLKMGMALVHVLLVNLHKSICACIPFPIKVC